MTDRRFTVFRPDDGDHIESKRTRFKRRLLLQPLREARESAHLVVIHLLLGHDCIVPTGLHLDDHNGLPIGRNGDEIGLVFSGVQVALENSVAALTEIPRGSALPRFTERARWAHAIEERVQQVHGR